MHNLKKYAIWAAVIAAVFHFKKMSDDKAKAKAKADAENAFNPQD